MTHKSNPQSRNVQTEWNLARMTEKMPGEMKVAGKPEIVKSKYGKAVSFNGSSDAIILESMPLTGLQKFTIEVIFQPQSGGNFEQRFLHCGETQGDRILLELRSTATDWYFDAFVKVGEQQCTLIDPKLLHPLDQWYHVAYVIDNGKLETFVNGKKELAGNVTFSPVKGNKTSIGVRQNEVSWFKGAVYCIRFTDNTLSPEDFMDF
ncbi:MAG: LamG domain-containing protein [Bacteroidia bacterium]|nr:LamG domain-containing protein [Bacteroidia bacterium]